MGSASSIRPGTLYIVATPIGNLDDITLRALKTLRKADLICCEDTRRFLKLLNRFKIKKPLVSFFEHNERKRIPSIIRAVQEGRDVALVTDAGTPGISDPGFPLIREAVEQGLKVVPIPGACAAAAAMSAAGLPTNRFLFLGFPPPKRTALKKLLLSLTEEPSTMIFYIPPRKLSFFLETVLETLGRRRISIAREMTKIHEEFLHGNPEELLPMLDGPRLKGEATVLISGTARK